MTYFPSYWYTAHYPQWGFFNREAANWLSWAVARLCWALFGGAVGAAIVYVRQLLKD